MFVLLILRLAYTPISLFVWFFFSSVGDAGTCTRIFVRLSWPVILRRMWTAGRHPSSGLEFIQKRIRFVGVDLCEKQWSSTCSGQC